MAWVKQASQQLPKGNDVWRLFLSLQGSSNAPINLAAEDSDGEDPVRRGATVWGRVAWRVRAFGVWAALRHSTLCARLNLARPTGFTTYQGDQTV